MTRRAQKKNILNVQICVHFLLFFRDTDYAKHPLDVQMCVQFFSCSDVCTICVIQSFGEKACAGFLSDTEGHSQRL